MRMKNNKEQKTRTFKKYPITCASDLQKFNQLKQSNDVCEAVQEVVYDNIMYALDNIAQLVAREVKGYNPDWANEEDSYEVGDKALQLAAQVSADLFKNYFSSTLTDNDQPVTGSTQDRIAMLEARLDAANQALEEAKLADDEYAIEQLSIDIHELEEELNFAWQDDESEYNYALERQEFNPDGSLKYY